MQKKLFVEAQFIGPWTSQDLGDLVQDSLVTQNLADVSTRDGTLMVGQGLRWLRIAAAAT